MFKNLFHTLSKALGPSAKAPQPVVAEKSPAVADPPAPPEAQQSPEPPKPAPDILKTEPPKAKPEPAKPAAPPEELCGVVPGMSTDEIRERLAFLYKRYNRATSSLDAVLRAEAEMMLDAVVVLREKHFGPI